jgi:hypothetical protein
VPSKFTSNGIQGSGQKAPTAYETCPPASVFSQSPYGPNDLWNAFTSDNSPEAQYLCFENFSGITQPVTAVGFWGLNLMYDDGWYACNDESDMTFEVKFYQDNAGSPGAEVYSESITVLGEEVAPYFLGSLLYYRVGMFTPVNLSAGWISIQGTSVGSPNNCLFLWMSSPTGDGSSYQADSGNTMSQLYSNLSICIEADSELVPEVPVALWTLGIGLALIAGSVILRYRRVI